MNRLLECPSDTHDLTDRLHRTAEGGVDPGELFQVPSGNLDDNIVQAGFETGARLLGDRVLDLVEGNVKTQLGGDESQGVTGGLGRERRRSRETSVDFDDAVFLRVRVEGVLNVALSDDSQVSNNVDGGGTEHVVIGIGQGLRGSDDNRVSGVDTEGIKVLQRTGSDVSADSAPPQTSPRVCAA